MSKRSSDLRKKENTPIPSPSQTGDNVSENVRLANEIQRLRKENEQRNAELAILNSVQEGLASKLDIQSIYELVGERLHQVFPQFDISVAAYNPETNVVTTGYMIEHGKRINVPAFPVSDRGFIRKTIQTKKTIVVNENLVEESRMIGSRILEGTDAAKSHLLVPLVIHDVVRGFVGMQDMEREHAFSVSDVRLLETIADSMSVALENARLFAETEQRAAELQIINSVQEGLSAKLELQGIYDLVGDKIREIFHAQGTAVYIFNLDAETLDTPYCFLKQRFEVESRPFSDHPIASLMVDTIRPILYRTVEEYRTLGGTVLENSEEYKSGMYVPLMVGKEIKGMLGVANLDKEYAYGESDLRLLNTLANSMSVALENARLFAETEQRAAELQIINSVQEGLATKLDIQSIYDLVGDKIREIFHNADTEIRIHDPKTNLIRFPYFTDQGNRIVMDPIPLTDVGVSSYILRTGKTVVINENLMQEMEKYGGKMLPGGHPAKSAVFVPLAVNNQARGLIVLGDVEREHAFSESDVRVLQTLANSMSTALENARLFDETQSLLQQTQQRNAELAIINSVQAGLASKLDVQAVYDLVGDKICDLLNAQSVWIITFDPSTRTRRVRYSFENGRRYYPSEVFPYNKLAEHLIATKKPLVINQNFAEAIEKFEMVNMAGTQEQVKSIVYIPIMAGEDVNGFISLPNTERENAFSESDVNLLSTFAFAMSIALENIRLFDETRRLLKETEQRAAELQIINSVQEGLSSKLDMQAIYELVGDKMQEIFDAQSLLIVTFDHVNELAHMTYNREKGIRYYSQPYPFTGLHRYLIQSRNTVVINENSPEWQKKFGMILVPGTEAPKSMIFVPLTAGYRVSGAISLQNLEREHAFSETDVRLLETLASSMSVALENASLFDETQRLFLEAKEARMAAEQANQAKSAFLSSMSHELRTPLNAIINFVEMVARGMIGPVNQEQVELLDQALHSSKHLLNLINDVLDISKIQAGQLTLFVEDQVSVQPEVEAALSIVGGLLQEKHLQLIRDIDPHLPMISCDRRRLRQVLLNLISNAIKFTNEGTITVSVKNQGQEVLFAVIDSGPGIPQDKQDLIFEPFIQAENGERQIHGTGLGLPISRSLVRAHGGELWVQSEDGEGSAFFFTLPVERRSTA